MSPGATTTENATRMLIDDNAEKKWSTKLFGRPLEDVPCFRQTFLTSISGGLALGIGHFMFTSKVKRSTDIAVFSFSCITIVQWFYCRYMDSVRRFNGQQLKHAMEQRNLRSGTDKMPKELEG